MTDAHCHPWDLREYSRDVEAERRETGTTVAASSWNREQFEYHEDLRKKALAEGAPPLFCCFALHPQLSADFVGKPAFLLENQGGFSLPSGTGLLWSLAAEGRLDAVGEAGFDLYDERYRSGEKIQEEMFVCQLEAALHHSLPMVLHVRKAMHKIFPFAGQLKKLPAVVFHSWPGTGGEGEALLKKGVNAFFSFGTVVLKNHKEAMACAASFPADRILLETDAPYQPLRGKAFSSWSDLGAVCSGITALRKQAGSPCNTMEELKEATTANFFQVFSG